MTFKKMAIEYWPVEKVIPYDKNPRNNDEAVEATANSIKEFGFKQPIVVDQNGIIIVGHTRLKAAQKLGLKQVPVMIADDLSDIQVKAYRLADNKVGELADWNYALLDEELTGITDIDMEEFGFDLSIPELDEVVDDEFNQELPEKPKSKLGEIYNLGSHRLMVGDSTDAEQVEKLMGKDKADMVFTDPPYGIDYGGGRTNAKEPKGKLKNDDLQGVELGNLISNVFTFNKAEADVYICVSPIMQKPFLDILELKEKPIDAVIVWDKKIPGLGFMTYRRQCEFIYFIKGGKFHKGDKSDFDLWSIQKDASLSYMHSTQKPVKVPGRAIKNSSKKDDIVLDLFGGSGSTLIACEQLRRDCRMMELDPKYADVIIKRWEEFTGKKAVKITE